jgi:hypothetical protein
VVDERTKPMLKYIELKIGYADNGPAWIARVTLSKSRRTVYFNGKALKRGNVDSGNHYDVTTGDGYWVSGIKRRGLDRHWAGSGRVAIEASAVVEYLQLVGLEQLDPGRFEVIPDLTPTSPSTFYAVENKTL